MATERTDTRGEGLQPGRYVFTISEPVVKRKWESGSIYYDWKFNVAHDGNLKDHNEKLAPWKLGPLLKALNQKEIEPGIYEWDKEAVVGLQVAADIVLDKAKNSDRVYRRMANFSALDEKIPF